ncbi:MAG TPA: hypothetical protein VIP80_10300 [Gemmatimonadales bacterium]|jgi:hypothetical protein
MGKYWFKIGLGAALIFVVGFGLVSAARRVRGSIESDHSIGIPLGAFGAYLPFKLEGLRIGTLRSLTIQRNSPREITGFTIRARVADSAALDKLRDCQLSIADATHFDERSTFACLASSTGYQAFGEVRAEYRNGDGSTTLVLPLLLSDAEVQEFRRHAADQQAAPLADSLAASLTSGVRSQARVLRDSIRADSLERVAQRIRQRVDSLRGKSSVLPPPAGQKP